MEYKIYILTDPFDENIIKYVGITKMSLLIRLGRHLSRISKYNDIKNKWILSLEQSPKIFEIDSAENKKEAVEKEIFWIEQIRSFGFDLVNSNGLITYKSSKRIKIDVYDFDGNIFKRDIDAIDFLRTKNTGNIIRAINKGYLYFGYRIAHVGGKLSKMPSKYYKEVHKYSITGDYIESFKCARLAKGFSYKNISKACLGNAKTHKGFIWSYNKVKSLTQVKSV